MVLELIQIGLTNFINTSISFAPQLFLAIFFLLVGWIIAYVIARIIKTAITRYKIDERLTRTSKPVFRLSDLLPVIFFWAIYLVFITQAVGTLQLAELTTTFNFILAFIPGLIKAILIVVVGYALGEYVRDQLEKSGIMYSDLMSSVLFFFIIYVSIALALPQVGIDPTLINNILLIIIGSIGAGMAIAIGLGMKDVIRDYSKKYANKIGTKKRR